jgi:hypothetical protein
MEQVATSFFSYNFRQNPTENTEFKLDPFYLPKKKPDPTKYRAAFGEGDISEEEMSDVSSMSDLVDSDDFSPTSSFDRKRKMMLYNTSKSFFPNYYPKLFKK